MAPVDLQTMQMPQSLMESSRGEARRSHLADFLRATIVGSPRQPRQPRGPCYHQPAVAVARET